MAPSNPFDRSSQRSVPVVLIAVAVLLLASRLALQLVPASDRRGQIRWLSPEEAAADTTGKPHFYDFTAEWCPPCHRLEGEVFADRDVAAEINERFVPVRVVDRMQEEGRNRPAVADLQRRYGVDVFPTLVIADPTGERARMEGFSGREQFERMMSQVR